MPSISLEFSFSPPGGLDGASLSPSTALDGSPDIVAHTSGTVPDCFAGRPYRTPPAGLDSFPGSACRTPSSGLDSFPG